MIHQTETRIGVIEKRIDGSTPVEAQLVARVGQLEDQMRIVARKLEGYGELTHEYEKQDRGAFK